MGSSGKVIHLACWLLFKLLAVANSDPMENDSSFNAKLVQITSRLDTLLAQQAELANLVRARCVGAGKSQFEAVEANQSGVLIRPVDGLERDLFHFNRLAENAIPTGNEHEQQASRPSLASSTGSLQVQSGGSERAEAKRQLLALSQHYETMFAGSLGTLSSSVREHLAAFRLGLNKLMSRLSEQNYQYNELASRLSLLKDDVSLVAAQLGAACSSQSSQSLGEPVRSSDISALARLMSREMSDQFRRCSTIEGSALEERIVATLGGELENVIARDLAKFKSRLDEIDSVAKQSALMLAKLAPGQSGQPLTLTYNSTGSDPDATAKPDSLAPAAPPSAAWAGRWFPGSKVPGKLADQQPTTSSASSAPRRPSCQSKTNLVRPTSCRQLRLAGANCSGQYYIFKRGAIKHVYCDMNMDTEDLGGGWTLVLRRLDKSLGQVGADQPEARKANQLLEAAKQAQVDFNQDWLNYKLGFGELSSWAEYFIGLNSLHSLAGAETVEGSGRSAPVELQLDLETNRANWLHLRFARFQVANETSNFRLELGPCNASSPDQSRRVCEPMSRLNGSQFYTHDRAPVGSCRHPFGWWMGPAELRQPECSSESGWPGALTAPLGADRHLFWPHWAHADEPIRKLVLKVRQLESSTS